MPESYEPYIAHFGVFTSTPKVELCMCSFRDKIYLGFTSRYDCDAIKENFFQILKEQEVKKHINEILKKNLNFVDEENLEKEG